MAKEYIDKEAFVAEKRKLYCEDCDRRKSTKDKTKFVYDIGDAPCRACNIDDMIDAVEDFPAADVVEVVRCKDCKHWQESETSKEYGSCDIDALLRWDDFFCAAGDMREVD